MLRTSGDVLYVGKATSIRHRVNSYFRKQSGMKERTLEMLSQARAISCELAASPLEAALLECDEIKRLHPPYNVALGADDRAVWFAAPDLGERRARPSARCPLGPFPAPEVLDQFRAMADHDPAALGRGRWGPAAATFEAGYQRLCEAHDELSRDTLSMRARLLRLGTRLWREGRRDHDVEDAAENAAAERMSTWTPEQVQRALEWLAIRASLARRRARWLTRLADAAVLWREPGTSAPRLIVVENGDIIFQGAADPGALDARGTPPVPPGHRRSTAERRQAFTLSRFDRLRVLSTELKRLVAADAFVAVRLNDGAPLADDRLRRVLSWV
jgi:DNA polymerase-3 subunit epsilon